MKNIFCKGGGFVATYKEIQKFVKQNYGFVPATCLIAQCKEILGCDIRKAWNRQGARRKKYCTDPYKLYAVQSAIQML